MGCAVCLDDFNQADGDAKRATALQCGHIFHYECLQTWLYSPGAENTHRPYHQRCPLCSAPTKPETMVRLFPSDGDDLDIYLSGKQQWVMEGAGSDGDVQPDEMRAYNQLLYDLMDFNKAIQSYVMATHSVHLENMVKSGVKVRKLIKDLTKHRATHLDESLMSAIDALEDATGSFSIIFNDLSRRCRNNRKLEAKLNKEKETLQQKIREAEDLGNKANATLAEAHHKVQEANRRLRQAEERDERLTMLSVETKKREESLDTQERDLKNLKRTLTLETNLKLSNLKSTTEKQLIEMRSKMEAALQKSAQAEKDRAAAHRKNCQLAEQLRQMQERLKSRKDAAPPGPSQGMASDNAAKDRRIRALEARLESQARQLKDLGIMTSERRIARLPKHSSTGAHVDRTRCSSPLDNDNPTSPETPYDGFNTASQASTSAALPGSSPLAQSKGKKRIRTSISVEPERLDDEMDEALFPMPGFAGGMPRNELRAAPIHLRFTSDGTAKPTTAGERQATTPAAPPTIPASVLAFGSVDTPTERKTPSRKRKPRASDPSNTTTNRHSYDWLNKPTGLALGPRRRSKASGALRLSAALLADLWFGLSLWLPDLQTELRTAPSV